MPVRVISLRKRFRTCLIDSSSALVLSRTGLGGSSRTSCSSVFAAFPSDLWPRNHIENCYEFCKCVELCTTTRSKAALLIPGHFGIFCFRGFSSAVNLKIDIVILSEQFTEQARSTKNGRGKGTSAVGFRRGFIFFKL